MPDGSAPTRSSTQPTAGASRPTAPRADASAGPTRLPPDHAAELARLDRMARLLDARFSILGFRFGYDAILGLVPGIGDTLALAPSAWLIWKARELGVSRSDMIRMLGNTGVDYVIGLVPLVGDLFDAAYKGNLRNVAILRRHLEGARP